MITSVVEKIARVSTRHDEAAPVLNAARSGFVPSICTPPSIALQRSRWRSRLSFPNLDDRRRDP